MKNQFVKILPALFVLTASRPGFAVSLTNSVTAARIAPCIRDVSLHDPSTIIKCKNEFWIFSTGRGVLSWHSKDLVKWERGPGVFVTNLPPWTAEILPANRGGGLWAPDVARVNGRYLLYYSASSFGKNVSGIGLVTSPTLDPNDPAYQWTDRGTVITSKAGNDFNAIDPAVFEDKDGSLWLTFGSFWSGIKMIQLDPQTGQRLASDSPLYSLAHYDSIEASYLYQHGGYYYLFVNWGLCCRGVNSTYRIAVGRSEKVTGPYLDADGKNMLDGGGTIFLDTTTPYVGPGHAGIIEANGKLWLSCHFEATEPTPAVASKTGPAPRRSSRLAIIPLRWNVDQWPQVDLTPIGSGR